MSGAREFLLPDLGEGLVEAEILRWLVTVGDPVAVDQPVIEVETAKAAVEVPSPYGGVVVATHGEPGDRVRVGAPLILVSSPDQISTPDAAPEHSGNVLVGYGTSAGTRRRRSALGASALGRPGRAGADPALGASAAASDRPGPAGADSGGPPASSRSERRTPVVSPLVRRLAREHGLDVATLRGSGPDGLVLRADVERAIARRAAQPAAGAAPAQPPQTRPDIPADAERIPLRGVRRAVAEKTTRSRQEIPDATTWVEVDATGLLAARAALNAGQSASDPPISVLALLARFAVAGLRRFPELNVYYDAERAEIVRLPFTHLSFAARTDRGLTTPVVRDAHLMSTQELAVEISRLSEAARAGRLAPAQLTGGTFTVNNYGVFGVDGATPIINHPEVAMLGLGRITAKPWVVGGELMARQVTQLTLVFDHRVCDGDVAGGFLRHVADCVEQPTRLLRMV